MKKGITLIEILVTAVILAFSLGTMMYSFAIVKRINIRNSHIHNATQIISQHFEEIQRMEGAATLDSYLSSKELIDGIAVQRKSSFSADDYTYRLRIMPVGTIYTTATANVRIIEAVVDWSPSNTGNINHNDRLVMRILSNEPNVW